MWPAIRDWFLNFFTSKTYFESWWDRQVNRVRGLLITAGAGNLAFAGQIADKIGNPVWKVRAEIAGILLMGVGGWLRAGDKTPANIKAMSQAMSAEAAATSALQGPQK